MNKDILVEIIRFLNYDDTKNYTQVNKLFYDACETFYTTKTHIDFNIQNRIQHLSNKQTYFIYDTIKHFKNLNDKNYNSIILQKKCFFPSMLCKLVNLETLGLNFGRIRKIPAEITALMNLRTLNLSCNYISLFPNELLRLTKLENLNLSHNELEVIPDISNLTTLKVLDFSHNNVQYFEVYDKMIKLPGLAIDLNNNINFKKNDKKYICT